MFLTTHAAAGIFLSQQFDNPYAVFAAAFTSHFVLDFIPHGDDELYRDNEWKVLKKYRRVVAINAIDLAGLVGLMFWSINHGAFPDSSLVLIGILGSVLPDFFNHFFPVIHQKWSWLFLVRWLYTLTKPTGLRYFVRAQNWFHDLLHHDIIRSDISFRSGLILQSLVIIALLGLLA